MEVVFCRRPCSDVASVRDMASVRDSDVVDGVGEGMRRLVDEAQMQMEE